jgi:hypothetical protein
MNMHENLVVAVGMVIVLLLLFAMLMRFLAR